jgi:hypothetical protein
MCGRSNCLLWMIRRKVKKRKDEKKKTVKNVVVTPQWNYIKNCTHNLTDKTCSLCKLIEMETAQWLADEHKRKNRIKMENFYKRAEMRYGLLREWSQNQLSQYSDVLLIPTGEIILCSSILDSLSSFSSSLSPTLAQPVVAADAAESTPPSLLNEILENLTKNLMKRNRILEVGQYAATFIQCRIRGLCCRKRITSFLLRRFEYHEESVRRGAYFLDKQNGNRFYSTPYLISHERPGSPRTIQRRITFQNKIRDKRMEKYQELCRDVEFTKEHEGGPWKAIETEILLARQLVLLRDLIFCLFKELSQKRRELGERPVASQSTATDSQPDSFAYWFTMSNPAPPARQIFLSLALETDPLEKEEEIISANLELQSAEEETTAQVNHRPSLLRAAPKRVLINPMVTVSSADTDETYQIPQIPTFDLNERLKQLDLRVWEMMNCHSADEMVAKIINCEEIHPTISSCQQISEDEHQIWKNTSPQEKEKQEREKEKDREKREEESKEAMRRLESEEDIRERAVMGQYRRALSNKASISRSGDSKWSDVSEEEEIEKPSSRLSRSPTINPSLIHGTYLPCQLQIHPFYPNRSPSGIVRLFFIDGVLSGISHSSPWVFYPEVLPSHPSSSSLILLILDLEAQSSAHSQCL